MRVWWDGVPESVRDEIGSEGLEFELLGKPTESIDVAHIFVTGRRELEAKLHQLMPLLAASGMIWVSWPKKASKVPTDITEDGIREVILPNTDLVDVKVCAVDETWSGLKLMRRKESRTAT